MGRRAALSVVVLMSVGIGLLPITVMFGKSVLVDGRLTLAAYRGVLTSERQWALLGNSFTLALAVAALATTLGLPLGILLARTDLPWRRFFAVFLVIPLVVPPYITAVSWLDVLGRQGLLTQLLPGPVAAWISSQLFGFAGCVLVLASTFLPIPMLLTMVYLRAIDPRLEEAGRLVSGWLGVLKGITVPLILRGILLASTLVFLLSLGEFGVPMFFRYDVFPVESFTQFSAFLNFRAATAAAGPLAAVTFLLIALEWILFRDPVHLLRPAGAEPPLRIELGHFRGAIFLLVALFCFFTVMLPISGLLAQSASLAAYTEAFARANDSLLRSLALAAAGATLLTLFGWMIGYLVHTQALPGWRAVDFQTLLLFAMPGTVIGIGLVTLWNRPETSFIYATPIIILLGYVAQYTAVTSRVTVATLAQIPRSMEDAAQVSGAGWLRCMALILVPLARRGLAAAWLIAYIFCLRDLGISMLVYPPGRDTLPVRTFTMMANGSAELIAALCVLMVAATLLPLALLGLLWLERALRGLY